MSSPDQKPQSSPGTSPYVVVMTIVGALVGFILVGPICWVIFTAIWGEGSWGNNLQWWGWALIMSVLAAVGMGGQAKEHVEKEKLKEAQRRFYERYGSEDPPDFGSK